MTRESDSLARIGISVSVPTVTETPESVTINLTLDFANTAHTVSSFFAAGDARLMIDDDLVFQSRSSGTPVQDPTTLLWAAGSIMGVKSTSGSSSGTKTKTYNITLHRPYFGWAAGTHLFRFDLYQDHPVQGIRTVGEVLYRFGLSEDVADTLPIPQLVPGKIMRGCFLLYTEEPRNGNVPGGITAIKNGGVNFLSSQIFPFNPGDSYSTNDPNTDLAWQANVLSHTFNQMVTDNFTNRLVPEITYCRNNGIYMLGEGDAIYRNPNEQWWYLNHPQRNNTMVYLTNLLGANSDVVKGVQGMDETEFQTGFGNIDIADFMTRWRTGTNYVPYCWPGQYPTSYETAAKCDNWAFRYYKRGTPETADYRGYGSLGWQYPQLGRLHLYMGSINTNYPLTWVRGVQFLGKPHNYRKMVAGTNMSPGDLVTEGGTEPNWMAGLAYASMGCQRASVLRAYLYDRKSERDQRTAATPPYPPLSNPNGFQAGLYPGLPTWDALSAAYNSIADLESAITTRTMSAVIFEDNWMRYTVGTTGIYINFSPVARQCPYTSTGNAVFGPTRKTYHNEPVPTGGVVID